MNLHIMREDCSEIYFEKGDLFQFKKMPKEKYTQNF